MSYSYRCLLLIALLPAIGAAAQNRPSSNPSVLRPGLIPAEAGGAPGYQHGLKQSHFILGTQPSTVTEAGWSRHIGPSGAFSVSLHNGVAMALPNAHAFPDHKPFFTGDPQKHDELVLRYFTAAGIPKDQIGGVHTMTRLSSGGQRGDARPTPLKIDGYVSVLERKVEGYPVPDSVAWAQMDNSGRIISEGVYWPAIPATALRNARRIKDQLGAASSRTTFLAHIPTGLPSGQIAIRHSSASDQQDAFEVLASYDVIEKRLITPAVGTLPPNAAGLTIVRHYDADGTEQRLPQERRNAEKQYPAQKKAPVASSSTP